MKVSSRRTPDTITENDVEKERQKLSNLLSRFFARLFQSPGPLRVKPQPRKMFQTENDKNFRVDIDMTTCIHGFLESNKKQPASLIIFAVQFVCLGKKGSFKRIKMDLDFEEVDGNGKPSHLEIIAHAPYILEEEQKVSQKKIKRMFETEFSTHTDISIVFGKAGVHKKISEQTEESFVKRYSGKAASSTRVDKKSGRRSGVWWNVKKSTDPDKTDDNINSNHHFAVLLTRDNKSEFQARIKLFVDAGWRYIAENKGSKVTHVDKKSPNVRFSPSLWYEGQCRNIDRKSLGVFQKEGKLADLTKSRMIGSSS